MKYYVMEVTNYIDGSKPEVGVYAKDSKDDAFAMYHTKMGSMMKNGNCASELISIVNSAGGVEHSECWERELEE